MFDDVFIIYDVLDGLREVFEIILYVLLLDGINKEIIKIVFVEKVDISKYLEGISFIFKEINYDKDGNINGKYNEDLKEKF